MKKGKAYESYFQSVNLHHRHLVTFYLATSNVDDREQILKALL